jgi:hypothetical protein
MRRDRKICRDPPITLVFGSFAADDNRPRWLTGTTSRSARINDQNGAAPVDGSNRSAMTCRKLHAHNALQRQNDVHAEVDVNAASIGSVFASRK